MEWWSNARPKLHHSAIQLLLSFAHVRAAHCGSRNRVNTIVAITSHGKHFDGGEFILCEQRPRQQSRVEAFDPDRGDAIVFSVHHRPVRGLRGYYRATLRHGVSTVHSGERYTLGIIFHDAK